MTNDKTKVIIVGGGLVGSLCACFMAKKGYDVEVYERRDDIRNSKIHQGRSINLALSHRGRRALRTLELESEILETAIPMKGRLLHGQNGQTKSILYDPSTNQCIYSVGRNFLNQTLLQAAESYPNVKLYFNQKLIRSSFKEESITVLNTKTYETQEVQGDLIIGADGAFSALRGSMQQTPLFEFSQKYIEHGYLELSISPKKSKQMIPEHLHIWPRGEFMMIALPNQDQSWTVTLFMPFKNFKMLSDSTSLLTFFRNVFPDSINLIGETELIETFFKTKPSALVSVKCKPYHVGNKFLLIGDAAHAMVPFYGQGMNAGFEDCSVLNDILDRNKGNIKDSIKEFTKIRVENTQAICDLAMYNYIEMRDLVTRPTYRFRKMLDDALFKLFPNFWIPLYNSVSFSHMDYTRCIQNRKWQDSVIRTALIVIVIFTVLRLYALYLLDF